MELRPLLGCLLLVGSLLIEGVKVSREWFWRRLQWLWMRLGRRR